MHTCMSLTYINNVMPKMIETVILIAKSTPKTTPTMYASRLQVFCSTREKNINFNSLAFNLLYK